MLKNVFLYYRSDISEDLKHRFEEDFIVSDKSVLKSILLFSAVIATITSTQHGYYILGMVGGGGIALLSTIAYNLFRGTLMCRVIMALGLSVLMVISIQQSHGLGEGHFMFFLAITILSRYRDPIPLILLLGMTVLHHLTVTYCQYNGIEILGSELQIFNWGQNAYLGLMAPFIYHIIFAGVAAIIAVNYQVQGNINFVESSGIAIAVEQAAEGKWGARIEGKQTDLAVKMNKFFDRLQGFMDSVNNFANSMHEQAVQKVSAAKTQFDDAKNQKEQVYLAATSVKEMAVATQDIAQHSEQTASAISSVADASAQGRELANSFNQSISNLAQRMDSATANIAELERRSDQIHGIIATIQGVAEQTNLLALNAAIEAARAGEQGRGFAVVADEVRVLSQRTHDSTQEISNMITALHTSTHQAVLTMRDSGDLAASSVADANTAAANFTDIANSMVNINRMANQIATSAEEQTTVIQGINANTDSIKAVSESFLESSKTSSEHAKELQSLSSNILQLLGEFRR